MNVKMSRKWLFCLSVTLGISILLWAMGSAMAQEPEPAGDVSVAATVNSRISYQGVLKQSGLPVSGPVNMVFRLYSDSSCTTQVGGSIAKPGVSVTNGQFSLELDVDHHAFDGQGLWLEVDVGGTTIGCEEILPVPYALSLRPGAEVIGGVASPSAVLSVTQSNAGSAAFGVYGYGPTTGVYGLAVETGVMGHSYGHQGGRAGVYGDSVMGVGVRGNSDYYHGVYGESNASSHHGGHFVNLHTAFSSNQVGVWAGSYWNNVIEGHDLDSSGGSIDRVFRVSRIGDVYADGTYYGAGGVNTACSPNCADFAETMDADRAAFSGEPGDVLVVNHQGLISLSNDPYAANVVGVHSTRPAFLARAGHTENQVPVALVGIVPVKASAENGPIQPGDLLTTSSIPGHAMRCQGVEQCFGRTVGKALEPLGEGTGVIQMLIMLQ